MLGQIYLIQMNIKNILKKANDSLLNDDFRQSFLIIVLSFVLAAISFIAAIPHWIDEEDQLKIMAIILTVVFALSLAILLLTIFVNKKHAIWRRIFMFVLIAFFAYLCYDGGPDGFLHLWVLLIPAFAFITFGLYEGFIVVGPTFLAMIAFFYWPLSDFRKYSHTFANVNDGIENLSADFKLRMVLIFIVAMALGFFAELVRHIVAKTLKNFNEKFEYSSLHDSLTDLANQNFLAQYLNEIYEDKSVIRSLGCLFVDVDSFKSVNDNYGHLFGNAVLVRIARILKTEKDAFACRWGGDEFVVCFKNIDDDLLMRIGEKYRAAIGACTFKDMPRFHITVSIGAVVVPVDEQFNFDHVLELADFANRTAKGQGKDIVALAKKENL